MKLTAFAFLFLLAIPCCGQITTTSVAEAPKEPEEKYDSTKNFLGSEAKQYTGQDLYVRGLPQYKRDSGYAGFVNDYMLDEFENGNTYESNSTGFGTKYSALAEKYFTVLDVIADSIDDNKFFLKLRGKQQHDTLYYVYDARYPASFPFVTTGYFIKNKALLAGRQFVLKIAGQPGGNNTILQDIKTGLPVLNVEPGTVWTLTDFTIEEKHYTLAAIFENENHDKVAIEAENVDDDSRVFSLDRAQAYEKKFGQANWQLILRGKVQKGMTQEMCRLAWGTPEDVVTAKGSGGSPLELWNYKNNSLYFASGVLFDVK
ncbi:MAG TPA: hypothetical protein VHB48_18280 [Chitinophagaceae bacterium]|nr:hypothetical protein [Chitinophagaceae bacterium]